TERHEDGSASVASRNFDGRIGRQGLLHPRGHQLSANRDILVDGDSRRTDPRQRPSTALSWAYRLRVCRHDRRRPAQRSKYHASPPATTTPPNRTRSTQLSRGSAAERPHAAAARARPRGHLPKASGEALAYTSLHLAQGRSSGVESGMRWVPVGSTRNLNPCGV